MYLPGILLLANLLNWFWVIPVSQRSANSHMNSGPFIGTVYYVLAAVLFVLGSTISIRRNNIQFFLWFLALVGTFIYWGYKLHSLYCQGCANSG